MADGSIYLKHDSRRKTCWKIFCIHNTDLDIINRLSKLLENKIQIDQKIKPHYKQPYSIRVYSDTMFDFCYNITKSTTKSDKEIQLPKVPNKYFHHFIRGFFDGDGSINIKHYSTRHGKTIDALQSSFTAGKDTGNFLLNLRNKIQKFIPVGNKKIHVGLNSKKLMFNQYDTMLLCEWMYKNATWYLKRKKDIWDSTDKERLKNSKKYFSNKV